MFEVLQRFSEPCWTATGKAYAVGTPLVCTPSGRRIPGNLRELDSSECRFASSFPPKELQKKLNHLTSSHRTKVSNVVDRTASPRSRDARSSQFVRCKEPQRKVGKVRGQSSITTNETPGRQN